MTRMMHRYEIPVDDKSHSFVLVAGNDPVRTETVQDDPGIVEFWIEHDGDRVTSLMPRHFQIFGTGQELPDGARWAGTTSRWTPPVTHSQRGLVWHLFEVPAPEED